MIRLNKRGEREWYVLSGRDGFRNKERKTFHLYQHTTMLYCVETLNKPGMKI